MANRKNSNTGKPNSRPSRRDFLKTSVAASAGAFLAGCAGPQKSGPAAGGGPANAQPAPAPAVHSGKTPDKIRVGVIGCGGRGSGAAWDAVKGAPNIEIAALGDLFPDRIESCRKWLLETAGKENLADHIQVTDDRCFAGFDGYKGVLGCNVEMVILATPPGFRPWHYKAAIEAGKHVFMEKPVAVDPSGVRMVIAASELAAQRKLAVVTGTQRRHQPPYLEMMKRIHDGQIGEIVAAQCYWNQGALWVKKKEPTWSDMEWQCRNWLYFCWLSGDHIVEQHVHNLDVVNWAMKDAVPGKCVGMGGRQMRVEPEYGNIYDHFNIEYEYPNGVRTLSMCRQIPGCSDRVSERIVGTKGAAYMGGNKYTITGEKPWAFEGGGDVNPYVQEHTDLIASIRAGQPLNEGKRIAQSTLTAIMGRTSAYTGREIQWDWIMNGSKLDLTPPKFEMGDLAIDPVPMPGQTKLV